MLDPRLLYHVGVRVRDVDAAMAELGERLGLTWCPAIEARQQVWAPGRGPEVAELRFTYSTSGPLHVELLQGPPGSVWDPGDRTGIHHTGAWVDDVAGETGRLVAAGWVLEAAELPPEQGYGSFTYVRSPDGFLLEPVASRLRPAFERWWAGGATA
ncbi:MAG: VOC family protein [Acidimicrobiia bacterium]|nr:VOC family protein [Acidimicrobiia bacterium]